MSRVIINIATGAYIRGQERLRTTLDEFNDTQLLAWTDESQIGSPTQKLNPYAFKIYAFEHALKNGYKQILWVDASVYAVRNLKPIWDTIKNEGYIMQYAGHLVGRWANDKCLKYFGVSRDDAMKMLMYGNAGFLGLNFENEIAVEFFKRWKESMLAGMFIGNWNNVNNSESNDERCSGHRHDMTCGSIIAQQLGMEYKKGDEWLEYAAPEEAIKNDTIILKAQGITQIK